MNMRLLALGGLMGTFGLILDLASPALSQKAAKEPASFKTRLAKATKIHEEDIETVLKAIGPLLRESLASGQTIDLPGLGRFRVVRVASHKDLVNGRPAQIAAVNTVEFLPVGEMIEAANSRDAVAAETVPAFEYNPLPNQTKGLKTGSTRAPNSRTR